MTAKKHIALKPSRFAANVRVFEIRKVCLLPSTCQHLQATFNRSFGTVETLKMAVHENHSSDIADCNTCSPSLHMLKEWDQSKTQRAAHCTNWIIPCGCCYQTLCFLSYSLMGTLKAQEKNICWNTEVPCNHLEEVQSVSVALPYPFLNYLVTQLCALRPILPDSELATRKETKTWTLFRWMHSQESCIRWHILKNLNSS